MLCLAVAGLGRAQDTELVAICGGTVGVARVG